ncbi:hypothetical protein ACJJIK_02190 [Microbulbifer sp. ZKSA006]|uniref:hypothetical protein n=1 Tax=Microbulbifer sp. ZKSA006 TaxID=3243390 RepID=UPI00403A3DE1
MSFCVTEYYLVNARPALLDIADDAYLREELSRVTIYRSGYNTHNEESHRKNNLVAIKYAHQVEIKNEWGGAAFISKIYQASLISENVFDRYWSIKITDNDIEDIEDYHGAILPKAEFELPEDENMAKWVLQNLTKGRKNA